jgi:serine protease Do
MAATAITPAAFAQQPRTRDVQVYAFQSGGSYLGIGGMDVTPERAKVLNLKEERGVELSQIDPEGPAAKAGLKEGDVILDFNGQPVQSWTQLRRVVQETPIGRQVRIVVWRSGATQTLTATVGERKNQPMIIGPDSGWNFNMPTIPSMPEMPNVEIPRFGSLPNPMLGIMGEPIGQEEQLAEFFGVQEGVLVRRVNKGSMAEKAGMKAGDVVTKVDDQRVANSGEITHVLRNAHGKKTITVIVVRNKKEMPLTVTMEPAAGGARVRAFALFPAEDSVV